MKVKQDTANLVATDRLQYVNERPTSGRDLSSSTENPHEPNGFLQLVGSAYDSAKKLDPRKQLKPGSKRASTLTVITSMVGGGTLALPQCMLESGLPCTITYFVICATMCAWSLHSLILVGSKTKANSFYDIAKRLFGKKVAVAIEVLLIINLMLAAIAYLVMVKNLLPKALQIELHTTDSNPWTSSTFLVPGIAVLIVSPLALMPKVGALRYASLCGFCLVIYLTCITVYTFFEYCDQSFGYGCLYKSYAEVPAGTVSTTFKEQHLRTYEDISQDLTNDKNITIHGKYSSANNQQGLSATMAFEENMKVAFSVAGPVSINCAVDSYNILSNGTISLSVNKLNENCLQNLASNNVTLERIKYSTESKWITVSAIYKLNAVSIMLTKDTVWNSMDFYGLSWTGHFYTIPIIISSYAAHPTVLPIYIELQRKSPKDMWIVVVTGLSIATIIYCVLATFGYFTFLSDTAANYLLNNYHHDIAVVLAAVGLCLVCSLAIPLFLHAKRRSITILYYNHFSKKKNAKSVLRERLINNPEKVGSRSDDSNSESEFSAQATPVLVETPELAFAKHRPKLQRINSERRKPPKHLPLWGNFLATFVLLSFEAIISLYVKNIGVVMTLLGSTTFPLCCYVFPTCALWKVRKLKPLDKDIDNKLLIIVTASTALVSAIGVLGLLEQFGLL